MVSEGLLDGYPKKSLNELKSLVLLVELLYTIREYIERVFIWVFCHPGTNYFTLNKECCEVLKL